MRRIPGDMEEAMASQPISILSILMVIGLFATIWYFNRK